MQTPHLVVKLEDMAKTKPKIQKFKLSELHAAEYNPRVIDDSALEGLSNSISRFGCVEPIIVNTRGGKNVIIGGHQRYKALEKLGEKDAVCVTISCNKADEKLLNLTLNNPAIQGEFFEDINDYIDQIRAEMPDDTDYINLRIDEMRKDIFDAEGIEMPGLSDGDKAPFQQMTFTLHDSQVEIVNEATKKAKAAGPFDDSENENSNGNALARIAEAYLGQG